MHNSNVRCLGTGYASRALAVSGLFFATILCARAVDAESTDLSAPIAMHKKKPGIVKFHGNSVEYSERDVERAYKSMYKGGSRSRSGSRRTRASLPMAPDVQNSRTTTVSLQSMANCPTSFVRKGTIASNSVFANGMDLLFYNARDYRQIEKIHPHLNIAVPYVAGERDIDARKYDNRSSIAPIVGVRCLPTRVTIADGSTFPVVLEYREGEAAFR